MSNLFIHDIVGSNDFAVPATDAALATATTELDAILSGVANLDYERIVAWVETAEGAGASRKLCCLLERFEYSSEECPDATETQTMTAAIETALEADADITSIGTQDVHIFQAGTFFHWLRDSSSGFLYPATATDDIAVGGHLTPQGMWFDDGDLALGAAAMFGAEELRVVGNERLEGGVLMTEAVAVPITPVAGEGTWWVENTTPNLPKFTDDGPNTSTLLYVAGQLSLPSIDQVLIVDKTSASYTPDGSQQEPYNSIGAAITAATALTPTTTNRILILIYPGIYSEALTTADSFVYFAGFDRESTIIEQSSGSSPPLTLADDETSFSNLTFRIADGTHTGRIVSCSADIGGSAKFYNCSFVSDDTASPSSHYVDISGSHVSTDIEFHHCVFSNDDDTELVYYNHATGTATTTRFYDCHFYGRFYEVNSLNASTLECYQCEFQTSDDTTTNGAVEITSSRTLGYQFHGCFFTNTGTLGNALYGANALDDTEFVGCRFSGGSSGYDIRSTGGQTPRFANCHFKRGILSTLVQGGTLYVGTGPHDVPFYQSMSDAVTAINAGSLTHYEIVLLEDVTLAAAIGINAPRETLIDGQGMFTIDRSGAQVEVVGNGEKLKLYRVQVKGEILVNGNAAELIIERSRVEGRVRCTSADTDAVVRAHDSGFVGDATYTSPLSIGAPSSAFGGIYFSGCYLKGNSGSSAVLYEIDGTSTTYDFDSLYMERCVCMHGSLGTNNPFSGQGQGGSPPVNNYYAHTCTFNQEPALADPTYLVNQIDSGQRQNTIDPDGDYHFMAAAW